MENKPYNKMVLGNKEYILIPAAEYHEKEKEYDNKINDTKASVYDRSDTYYYIESDGEIQEVKDYEQEIDDTYYEIGNYATDPSALEKQRLNFLINLALQRFADENDNSEEITNHKYELRIQKSCMEKGKYFVYISSCNENCFTPGAVYFSSMDVAAAAKKKFYNLFEDYAKLHGLELIPAKEAQW